MTYIHTMVKMATAYPFQKVGFFFFFKPFILYWNIADYNAIVVSGGFLSWVSGKESACLQSCMDVRVRP